MTNRLISRLNSSEAETRQIALDYQREHWPALDALILRTETEALSEGLNVEDLPAGHIGHVFRGLAELAKYTLSLYEKVQALCDEGRFNIENDHAEVVDFALFSREQWPILRQSMSDLLGQ